MGYGIRVFRHDYGLSWRKARLAAKLFKLTPAKWPPALQDIVRQRSPSGVIKSFPNDLARIIADFVSAS